MIINQCSKTTNLTKNISQKICYQAFFMVIASYTAFEITAKMGNICV